MSSVINNNPRVLEELESLRQQLGLMKADLMLAQGDAVRLTGQLAECERERDELVEALEGLYLHTKNNMAICGLNEKAKSALAKLGAGKGEQHG